MRSSIIFLRASIIAFIAMSIAPVHVDGSAEPALVDSLDLLPHAAATASATSPSHRIFVMRRT